VIDGHFFCFQQRLHLANRYATFDPAFNIFDALNVFFIELTMSAFTALRFQQSITSLPGPQRYRIDCASFSDIANTVMSHRSPSYICLTPQPKLTNYRSLYKSFFVVQELCI